MHVLILADIEGSSGCWSRPEAAAMTSAWRKACWDMTADARAVVEALQAAGVSQITVHDFHRTGFNLIAQKMPSGCRVVSGYKAGPVPGLGDPGGADLLMMIGMHAPSGSKGFLAHTLTSRVAALEVNGRLLSEAELFSASLSGYGIRPVFLSGCPVACEQAGKRISGIDTYPIDKSGRRKYFNPDAWRKGLARSAVKALSNRATRPYQPTGPFKVRLALRDGPKTAVRLARRWGLDHKGNALNFECETFFELYDRLLCICYLTPLLSQYRAQALWLYSFWGRLGQLWVQRWTGSAGNI